MNLLKSEWRKLVYVRAHWGLLIAAILLSGLGTGVTPLILENSSATFGFGLDPAGIAWLRNFLRSLATGGRTILVSSHQLAEMQNTVDDVLIINKGKLIAEGTKEEVMGSGTLEEAFLKLTGGALS